MKEVTMILKEVPPMWYLSRHERIIQLGDQIELVYAGISDRDTKNKTERYLIRYKTKKDKTIEFDIPWSIFDVIEDEYYEKEKQGYVYEYMYGKDTVRVFIEFANDQTVNPCTRAVGPEENKEWQYEFQKYHI